MFKASIVSNMRYYALRRISAILGLIIAPVYGLIWNEDALSLWHWLLIGLILLIVLRYNYKILQSMRSLFGKERLVLDYDELQVLSAKKEIIERIDIRRADALIVRTDFEMSQEKLSDVFREIFKGRYHFNEIEIRKDDDIRKYKFEFDSYYMIRQLEKITEFWRTQGHNLTIEPGVTNHGRS